MYEALSCWSRPHSGAYGSLVLVSLSHLLLLYGILILLPCAGKGYAILPCHGRRKEGVLGWRKEGAYEKAYTILLFGVYEKAYTILVFHLRWLTPSFYFI